jgi:hypothetical protein
MMECRNHGKIVMLMLVILLLRITTLTAVCSRDANVVKQKTTWNGDGQLAHPVCFAAGAQCNSKFRCGSDGKRESGTVKSKPEAIRISAETKCPIHPNGNHVWGDYFQNIANKDKKKTAAPFKGKDKGKPKSAVVNTNAMQCNDESLMEMSGDEVINDPQDQDLVETDDIHGLCTQLNKHPDNPADLVKKKNVNPMNWKVRLMHLSTSLNRSLTI